MPNKKIALFEGKKIRKTFHKKEWWFVINDIIVAIADSNDPAQYFKRIKSRDAELKQLIEQGGVQFVPPLRLPIKTAGGVQKI
jgi:prophage antirepressor-like protein